MIKKIFISTFLLISLLISASTVNAADEMIVQTDDTNDVFYNLEENYSRPNIDIAEVSAIKTGDEVELRLKLAEGGTIQKSLLPMILYGISLQTSHHAYSAIYTGINLSELAEEGEEYDSECIVQSEIESIDVNSCTGEGENVLSIKFDLYSSNERLISIYEVITFETSSEEDGYNDFLIADDLYVVTEEQYEAVAGKPFTLEGSLEEGNPDDYEWLWVFDDSNIMLDGKTPTYTLNKPDLYTGIVYAYDADGYLGYEYFAVNVSTSSGKGGSSGNNQPGFEMVILIAAIAIALVILKKKR